MDTSRLQQHVTEEEARRQAAQQGGATAPDLTGAAEAVDGVVRTAALLPDLSQAASAVGDAASAVGDAAGGILEAIGGIFSGL
jgi:hypothetical protein